MESDLETPLTVEHLLRKYIVYEEMDDLLYERVRDRVREVLASEWFVRLQFKKHCLLSLSEEELHTEFCKLKDQEVYNILFSYIYENYSRENINYCVSEISKWGVMPS